MKQLFSTLAIIILINFLAYSGDNKNKEIKSSGLAKITNSQQNTAINYAIDKKTESFEGTVFPPAGWREVLLQGSKGWSRGLIGATPIPGLNTGIITGPPISGTNTAVAYITRDTANSFDDSWLVSDKFVAVSPDDTLSFWLRKFSKTYADTLEIKYVIKTFYPYDTLLTTPLTLTTFGFAPNQDSLGWTKYSFPIGAIIPGYASLYIIFREKKSNNINNGSAFFIDDVEIGGGFLVPVELTSFTAKYSDGKVLINWATATEANNKGFEVQKQFNDGGYSSVGYIAGQGSSIEKHNYLFIDSPLADGKYSYRLKQIDYDGSLNYSPAVDVDVSAPAVFGLEQNYPNPFNPSTTIKFNLPADSKVSLKIFDILGQPVATLIDGNKPAGINSVNYNAKNLTSGLYLYKLEAKTFNGTLYIDTKKMLFIK
jgi:hypothetical protein